MKYLLVGASLIVILLALLTEANQNRELISMFNPISCKRYTESPKKNCTCFRAKLSSAYDMCSLNGIIVAYKTRSTTGEHKWFVPPFNFLIKNRKLYYRRCQKKESVSLHRLWTYFYSHWHKHVFCKIKSKEIRNGTLH